MLALVSGAVLHAALRSPPILPGPAGWALAEGVVYTMTPIYVAKPRPAEIWEVRFLRTDEELGEFLTWKSRPMPTRVEALAELKPFQPGAKARLWVDMNSASCEPVQTARRSLPMRLAPILLAFLAGWLLRQWLAARWGNPRVIRAASLSLFLIPLLVLTILNRGAVFSVLTKWWLWEEVPAHVLDVKALTRDGRGGAAYAQSILFSYQWEGRTRYSNRFGALPPLITPVSALARLEATKQTSTCWVNPWNPEHAELQRRPGASGVIMLAIIAFWLQVCRQVHITICGPRKFNLARRHRRRIGLAGLSLARRAWMRLVWWFDPLWDFGRHSPATPQKDSAARSTPGTS